MGLAIFVKPFFIGDFMFTKELIKKIIDNNEFYEVVFSCPDCSWVDDDQYTCTTCWGQGGNTKYKSQNILNILFSYKYEENFKHDLSIDDLKHIIDNEDIAYYEENLYFDEYPELKIHAEEEWDNSVRIIFHQMIDFLL